MQATVEQATAEQGMVEQEQEKEKQEREEQGKEEQGSDAWLRRRRLMVTSTDASIIIGCKDAYKRKNQLFQEKVGLRSSEPTSSFSADMLDYGIELEPSGLRAVEELLGVTIDRSHGLCAHPQHAWMGGSPDGTFVSKEGERVLVELKCPTKEAALDVAGKYPIPERYRHQVQFLMACMGIKKTFLVRYFPQGGPLRDRAPYKKETIYVDVIERDDEWLPRHLPAFRQFHCDILEYGRTKQLKPTYQIRTCVRKTSDTKKPKQPKRISKAQRQKEAELDF